MESHALPMLYLETAVAQIWSHGSSIPFHKRAENHLGKKQSWVREANWLPCRWVPEPRKEGEGSHSFISVSCEQLTASLQALQEQITHLSSGDISADKEDMREIRENNICREAIFLLPHNQWQSCSPGLLRQLCLNKANAITITFILNYLRICLVFFSAQSSFLFKSFFLISWSVVKICWLS